MPCDPCNYFGWSLGSNVVTAAPIRSLLGQTTEPRSLIGGSTGLTDGME